MRAQCTYLLMIESFLDGIESASKLDGVTSDIVCRDEVGTLASDLLTELVVLWDDFPVLAEGSEGLRLALTIDDDIYWKPSIFFYCCVVM